MCIKWILGKMGQLKTYNDANLANRLVKAEQALKELKTNQFYFMNDTAMYESDKQVFNVESHSYDGYSYKRAWVGFLTFTGNKPDKDVIIVPKAEAIDDNGNVYPFKPLWSSDDGSPEILLSTPFKDSDRSNVCRAILQIEGLKYSGYPSFTKLRIWCVSNDIGKLEIKQEQYEWY